MCEYRFACRETQTHGSWDTYLMPYQLCHTNKTCHEVLDIVIHINYILHFMFKVLF